MTVPSRRSVRRRLLAAALADDEQARASWSSVASHLDLAKRRVPNADLLPVLSWRLAKWGIEDPHAAVFNGLRRRNWAMSSLALSAVAERARRDDVVPVLVGRAATVAAYQPAPGLLGVYRTHATTGVDRGLLTVDVEGTPMRVPVPSTQLVWALRHRLWVDAAFALRHPAMEWGDLLEDRRLRRRPSIHAGLETLRGVLGAEIPGPVVDAVAPLPPIRWLGHLTAVAGVLGQRVASALKGRGRPPSGSTEDDSSD